MDIFSKRTSSIFWWFCFGKREKFCYEGETHYYHLAFRWHNFIRVSVKMQNNLWSIFLWAWCWNSTNNWTQYFERQIMNKRKSYIVFINWYTYSFSEKDSWLRIHCDLCPQSRSLPVRGLEFCIWRGINLTENWSIFFCLISSEFLFRKWKWLGRFWRPDALLKCLNHVSRDRA